MIRNTFSANRRRMKYIDGKDNKTLKKSNQELQAKVQEAEPWFKLTEEEKKLME